MPNKSVCVYSNYIRDFFNFRVYKNKIYNKMIIINAMIMVEVYVVTKKK